MKKIILFLIVIVPIASGNNSQNTCDTLEGIWLGIENPRLNWADPDNFTQSYIKVKNYSGKYKVWVMMGFYMNLYEFLGAKTISDGCIFTQPAQGTTVPKNQLIFKKSKIKKLYVTDFPVYSPDTVGIYKVDVLPEGATLNINNAEKDLPGTKWD